MSGERDPLWLHKRVLAAADRAGLADKYWLADRQLQLSRAALGVPDDGRITHAHLWADAAGADQ